MPVQRGLFRIAPFKGRHIVADVELLRLRALGRAGEFAEIIFPVGIARQLAVIGGVFANIAGAILLFGRRGRLRLRSGLFQKRIFHQLLLHGFEQVNPRQLQQTNRLLQLRRHYQLLRKLELLP